MPQAAACSHGTAGQQCTKGLGTPVARHPDTCCSSLREEITHKHAINVAEGPQPMQHATLAVHQPRVPPTCNARALRIRLSASRSACSTRSHNGAGQPATQTCTTCACPTESLRLRMCLHLTAHCRRSMRMHSYAPAPCRHAPTALGCSEGVVQRFMQTRTTLGSVFTAVTASAWAAYASSTCRPHPALQRARNARARRGWVSDCLAAAAMQYQQNKTNA